MMMAMMTTNDAINLVNVWHEWTSRESRFPHLHTTQNDKGTQTRKDNVHDCDDNDNKDLTYEEYLSSSIS